MDSVEVATKRCFQCEKANPPEQSFCGACGSPLLLKDFIAQSVSKELATAVRDRDILETESAIKVFNKAWEWATLAFKVLAVPVGIALLLLGWVGWKEFDLSKTATNAKAQILDTATKAKSDVSGQASHSEGEMQQEAAQFKEQVAQSQSQIDSVNKLRPQFDGMRSELTKATNELDAQRKVLSSTEEFTKHVFSTHAIAMFKFPTAVQSNVIVVPTPIDGDNIAMVVALLPNTPIEGTLQVQFGPLVQPPYLYTHIHNLVLFKSNANAEVLKTLQMVVTYFPDTSDKTILNLLTIKDGQIFADGKPLSQFGELSNPDFAWNKWMRSSPAMKP